MDRLALETRPRGKGYAHFNLSDHLLRPGLLRGAGGMILREWRGWVPNDKAGDYLKVLERTGLKDLAATPGNRGTILLQTVTGDETEFVLMSLWKNENYIRAFAGDDVTVARYYPEDDDYLTFKARRVRHYRVIDNAEDADHGPGSDAGDPLRRWSLPEVNAF